MADYRNYDNPEMGRQKDLVLAPNEFIEYNLVLPPAKDRQYQDIIKKYNEEEE